MNSSGELFVRLQEGNFVFVFWVVKQRKNKHKKKHFSVHKQIVTILHTLFYFLHDITDPYIAMKSTILKHQPRVSLARITSW